jgi:uncharacterized protein YegP (UPF0339 family)
MARRQLLVVVTAWAVLAFSNTVFLEGQPMKASVHRLLFLLALVGVLALAGVHFAAAQAKKDKRKPKDAAPPVATGRATFELYKDRGGKYRFRLKRGDGKILAMSHVGYKDKGDIQKVIETIRREAARASIADKSSK